MVLNVPKRVYLIAETVALAMEEAEVVVGSF
jgi:hypothetical protein